MAVVIDANMIAALANGEPAGARVEERLEGWLGVGDELHAPALLAYEVLSAVRKAVWEGRLPERLGRRALEIAEAVPVVLHPPRDLGRAMEIAAALGRRRTGDAVYLALGERLEAQVATLDGPFARNAGAQGFRVLLV